MDLGRGVIEEYYAWGEENLRFFRKIWDGICFKFTENLSFWLNLLNFEEL